MRFSTTMADDGRTPSPRQKGFCHCYCQSFAHFFPRHFQVVYYIERACNNIESFLLLLSSRSCNSSRRISHMIDSFPEVIYSQFFTILFWSIEPRHLKSKRQQNREKNHIAKLALISDTISSSSNNYSTIILFFGSNHTFWDDWNVWTKNAIKKEGRIFAKVVYVNKKLTYLQNRQ